jgi:hypothetical protein
MSELNFVERIGLDFLRGRTGRQDSHVHKWSDRELSEIERAERWTIKVAALTGAISGSILAAVEIWLSGGMIEDVAVTHFREQLPYWSIYLSLAALVSGAELLYLYWFVLRMVARISAIAGLCLSAKEIEQVIARGLSRAAFEIPNPRVPIYGIDPYARVPRWKLIAYALFYRMKVGVTSFVLRVLLRRILARTALRFLIPLVAIPVFGIWNGLIARWVMREVRIRIAGPVVVQDLAEWISLSRASLTEESRRLILQSVGEAIIRGEDAHPNYDLLLTRLIQDLEISPESTQIDWNASRAGLKNLNPQAQDLLLIVLTATTILNSRLRKAQQDLLAEAHALCNRPFRVEALLGLRRQFVRGQGLSERQLKEICSLNQS